MLPTAWQLPPACCCSWDLRISHICFSPTEGSCCIKHTDCICQREVLGFFSLHFGKPPVEEADEFSELWDLKPDAKESQCERSGINCSRRELAQVPLARAELRLKPLGLL